MRGRAHSTKNANSNTSQKRAHFASAFEVLDRMGCRAQSRNHEAISFGNDSNIYIYIYNLLPEELVINAELKAFQRGLTQLVRDRVEVGDHRWRFLLSPRHALFKFHPLIS